MKAKNRGNDLQKRIKEIYHFIADDLYLNRPDLKNSEEGHNSTLLLGICTGLCGGKELIIGEPGLGKTTSAEYISALLYQYPLGIIWGIEVSGHPEQTEEKIIGRPDLGKLNKGIEEVVWSGFAQLPVKIVDEINRLPETKQSMILDGVDRGNWQYLNEMIINEEYCLFATANYQDRGTNTIIAPLVDRFDLMVESRHPGANIAFLIGMQKEKEKKLRSFEFERQFDEALKQKIPYEKKVQKFEELSNIYGEHLKKTFGIPTISKEERKAIRKEMEVLEYDLDANAFLRMFIAELSFCYKYGQKRSVEVCDEGCHFTGYLCYKIKNCASNRLPISLKNYAQALAWFLEAEEIDLEKLKAILPYIIAHRIQWKEDYTSACEKNPRDDPFPIYLAKEAVKEVFQRFREQRGEIKNALSIGFRIYNGENLKPVEGDHPLYWEIKKDLV